MDYTKSLKYHYKPKKGWINDPNGLVYFNGYYHIFYQHAPNYEIPWKEPFIWGHARTKDFITYEELPLAIISDHIYDNFGCWSGTAIVKDNILYLVYSSIHMPHGQMEGEIQTISVAYSQDGITFSKYEKNPVIDHYPPEGCYDFRDPAVACINNEYYLVVATGNIEKKVARLLLYKSNNLFDWKLTSVLGEWENAKCAECPSLMQINNKCLLATSVCNLDGTHFFQIMYGDLKDNKFYPEICDNFDKGPDQYAGQIFKDHQGRIILITWIPGWNYKGYASKDVGCLSIPREITFKDGKVYGYPIKEVQHLLKDTDPVVELTPDGFIIKRSNRQPIIYKGKINDLKILKDEYIIEVFVNKGETVYSALL